MTAPDALAREDQLSHADGATGVGYGIASGHPPRVYDFRLPETMGRSDLRGLRPLFEVFTHRVGGVMTTRLRTPATVNLVEFDQQSWDDYATSLPALTCLVSATLLPLNGRMVLHCPLALAMAMVDLRLGGTGKGPFPDRALSDIEQHLIGGIVEGIISELPAVFAPLIAFRASGFTQVSSVQFLPAVRPTDICLIVHLSIDLGEELVFPFGLCFPLTALRPIVEALDKQDLEEPTLETGDAAAVALKISETPVDITIQFPTTKLTPAEFLHLAVGDIVRLPYEQGVSLSLVAGGQHFLNVMPTNRGKRLACIVTETEETLP
jgi:flagellar motor switch protein FliM